MIEWVNFINKAYINLAAPLVKVFKMDKVNTRIDTLYVANAWCLWHRRTRRDYAIHSKL